MLVKMTPEGAKKMRDATSRLYPPGRIGVVISRELVMTAKVVEIVDKEIVIVGPRKFIPKEVADWVAILNKGAAQGQSKSQPSGHGASSKR